MSNAAMRYAPPANVGDFDQSTNPELLREAWHDLVSGHIREQSHPSKETARDYPGQRSFFDALGSKLDPAPVPWFAFPQALSAWYPDSDEKRWEAADALFERRAVKCKIQWNDDGNPVRIEKVYERFTSHYRQQDEYCEWFTHTDPATGRVTRVDFTAENPDYWQVLAENDIDLAVKLYRQYVSPDVQPQDLFFDTDVVAYDSSGQPRYFGRKDKYNPYNKWNTTHGAMHLTHPANNLFAEIVLAAQATVQRTSPDGAAFNAKSLACCAGYGGVRRSSDPSIGYKVNSLVADGYRVALADPVGLYIAQLDRNASGRWDVSRGSEKQKRILRASFYPNDDATYTYGGQIADNMQMNLYAIAEKRTGDAPKPEKCQGRCCDYPGRSGMHEYIGNVDCAKVDWNFNADEFIPFPRDADNAGAFGAFPGAEAELPTTFGPGVAQRATRTYLGSQRGSI
jgi:hypothetical protein